MTPLLFVMALAFPPEMPPALDHLDAQVTKAETLAKSIDAKNDDVAESRRHVEKYAKILRDLTTLFRQRRTTSELLLLSRDLRTFENHLDALTHHLGAVHDPAAAKANDVAESVMNAGEEFEAAALLMTDAIDERLDKCEAATPPRPNTR